MMELTVLLSTDVKPFRQIMWVLVGEEKNATVVNEAKASQAFVKPLK